MDLKRWRKGFIEVCLKLQKNFKSIPDLFLNYVLIFLWLLLYGLHRNCELEFQFFLKYMIVGYVEFSVRKEYGTGFILYVKYDLNFHYLCYVSFGFYFEGDGLVWTRFGYLWFS